MVEFTHSEKQFILYRKGWFEKSEDRMEDIKKIIGKAYGLYPEHVEMYNIIHFVTNLFDKLIQNGNISTEGHTPMYFILKYIFQRDLKRDDESSFNFIYNRIYLCNVRNLDLGDTDPSYLKPDGKRSFK